MDGMSQLTYAYKFMALTDQGPAYRLLYPFGFDNRGEAYKWLESQMKLGERTNVILFEFGAEQDAPADLVMEI